MPFQSDEEIQNAIDTTESLINAPEPLVGEGSARPYPGPGGREYGGTPPHITNGTFRAKYVFFYYFKFEKDGSLKSLIYRGEFASDLDTQIAAWIDDARSSGTLATSKNPDGVEWNQPSYLAAFLDNSGWKLIDFKSGSDASFSIHFSSYTDGNNRPHKNKTFFGARNRIAQPSSQEAARYVAVENHHLVPNGNAPRRKPPHNGQAPKDLYKFDLFYRVDVAGVTVATDPDPKRLTMIIDPGGHNTGPEN